jgi:hypothetical protein
MRYRPLNSCGLKFCFFGSVAHEAIEPAPKLADCLHRRQAASSPVRSVEELSPQAVTVGFVRPPHQACGHDRLLDHRHLAFV